MRQWVAPMIAGLGLAAFGMAAMAEPVSSRTARKQLFKTKNFAVELIANAPVSAATMAQAQALATAIQSPQMMVQFPDTGYYGAIAVVPDSPLSPETMAVVNKLHNSAIAQSAAVQACDAARAKDSQPCVAVALILPTKNEPRGFTLSQDASIDFRASWRGGRGPKYLAFSPNTRAWAIAKGRGADTAAALHCNKMAGLHGFSDCIIGVADE